MTRGMDGQRSRSRGSGLSKATASAWVRSWDQQQRCYIAHREERFGAILDVLGAYLPPRFLALDVGCGPGSLSERLLRRFPQARCVAVDYDPVLLDLGRHAGRVDPSRIRWVEADLRSPSLPRELPRRRFDAIVSTTALHWLRREELPQVYHGLFRLLRPGGLFLNGDVFPYGRRRPTFRKIATTVRDRWFDQQVRGGAKEWDAWWASLEKLPALHELFEVRRERSPKGAHHRTHLTLGEQQRLLVRSGFLEPTIVWREFTSGVMMAVKPRARRGS